MSAQTEVHYTDWYIGSSADSNYVSKTIIDTVDAFILVADWAAETVTWNFVKAIRKGHYETRWYSNSYTKNGFIYDDLVARSEQVKIWDDIKFYSIWNEILFEGKPVWAEFSSERYKILQTHFKDNE